MPNGARDFKSLVSTNSTTVPLNKRNLRGGIASPKAQVMSPIGDDGCVLGHGVAALGAASDREPIHGGGFGEPSDREPKTHLHADGLRVGWDRNHAHEQGVTNEHDRRGWQEPTPM